MRRAIHNCPACGRAHRAKSDYCNTCINQAKRAAIRAFVGPCKFCGADKPNDRLLTSPYCSVECSRAVQKITTACSQAVQKAIRAGQIQRIDADTQCVDCDGAATEYDHRDYTKPLHVVPVCHSCNLLRGPAHTFK